MPAGLNVQPQAKLVAPTKKMIMPVGEMYNPVKGPSYSPVGVDLTPGGGMGGMNHANHGGGGGGGGAGEWECEDKGTAAMAPAHCGQAFSRAWRGFAGRKTASPNATDRVH